MFQVGDVVIFKPDGAQGVVVKVNDSDCYVMWEDLFSSLEPFEQLIKDEKLTAEQRIEPRQPIIP
ncbi:uncharacterized protein YkvS [Caldalkalibacillus uzonensis]|uniref:Uncharacterized protein YkvS n=1 Tax=Caldalkalibacillus uzonensis TaxID=353224 RepID=A0ABU0CUC1_9BACI|nr:hypothetical protein [Caldalkalibacillus uzonensis]MDQ0339120.1 uncharacterized protein YkvS [Caldalkalibacillus uzonensis]